ncbi:MAG: hypothetical protein Q7R39_11880 [Dehalococcoidia bacterium]|nr:hypothetical protein [Dehalococcoidia bacterium]
MALVAMLALAVALVGRYVCIRAQSGTHFDPRVAEAFVTPLGVNGVGSRSLPTMTAGALRRPD